MSKTKSFCFTSTKSHQIKYFSFLPNPKFRYISLLTNVLEWQNQQDQHKLPDKEKNNNSVASIKSELTTSERNRTNKTIINKSTEMRNDAHYSTPNKMMRSSHNNLLMIAPLAKFNMEHRIKTEIMDDEMNFCDVAMTKDITDSAGRKIFIPSNIKENNPMQFKGCNGNGTFDTSSNLLYKNNLLSVHIERPGGEIDRSRNFADAIQFRPIVHLQNNSSVKMERHCSVKDGENGPGTKSGKNKRKNVGGSKALGEKRKKN